jgi:isoleucyl-tRNA synthetase
VARHDPEAVASVHHRDFPDANGALIDRDLEASMAVVREVVGLGRNLRKREGHRVRQPLARITILTRDPIVAAAVDAHADVISDELNVKEVVTSSDEGQLVLLSAKANFRKLGPLLGKEMPVMAKAISELTPEQLEQVIAGGKLTAAGREIGGDDMLIERTPREKTIVETGPDFAVALDTDVSDDLLLEGIARELISRVQRMRRDAGLAVTDRIALEWSTADPVIRAAIETHESEIAAEVLATVIAEGDGVGEPQLDIDGRPARLQISRA